MVSELQGLGAQSGNRVIRRGWRVSAASLNPCRYGQMVLTWSGPTQSHFEGRLKGSWYNGVWKKKRGYDS